MARRIIPHAPQTSLAEALLAMGEIAVDETTGDIRVGDGATLGGKSAGSVAAALARQRTNHTGVQPIATVDGLADALAVPTDAVKIGLFSTANQRNVPTGTDIVQTSGWAANGQGAARYVYDPAVDAGFVLNYPRMSFMSKNGRGFRLAEGAVDVKMFGAKGDGVSDDWPVLNELAIYMYYYGIRSVYFPKGTYCVSKTLDFSLPIQCAQFIGSTGYDGTRGPINFTMMTCIKWIGAADPTKAVVKFDRTSGSIWRGISINCDYKAGYGLQLMSSTQTDGSVKNIIENCSFHYAKRDGIIIGQEGQPTANPADRQFFGNVFRNLTMIGCARSAIHVNEWNADQQMFDTVMVYHDDASPVKHLCDNAFWFDYGGQYSTLINCQVGGLDVQAGKVHSGYMIRNQGFDSGSVGAIGLVVICAWQEGAGGLYYGVTTANDQKAFTFLNCASYTSDPNNLSMYIDKGTSGVVRYSIIGCSFAGNIKIATPAFQKRDFGMFNNTFAPGKGVVDADGRLLIDGLFTKQDTTGGSMVIPRLVDTLMQVLTTNVSIVYAEGVSKVGDKITLIITQDATGSRTIDWGASGNFSLLPAIPAPGTAPGAKTVYNFVSDGNKYYLSSAQVS